jgi:hypothetical protein
MASIIPSLLLSSVSGLCLSLSLSLSLWDLVCISLSLSLCLVCVSLSFSISLSRVYLCLSFSIFLSRLSLSLFLYLSVSSLSLSLSLSRVSLPKHMHARFTHILAPCLHTYSCTHIRTHVHACMRTFRAWASERERAYVAQDD